MGKKGEPLTEECFFKMPLKFVGSQSLRWGGVSGERLNISGTYVSEGTLPAGSTWAMNPIPCDMSGTPSFAPRCEEIPNCGNISDVNHCRCTGAMLYNLEIVDYVQIPAELPPGEYVLGFRWDCEESNQIWSSCSDVTV